MKKIIFSIILVFAIVMTVIIVNISNKNSENNKILNYNNQFEKYKRTNYVWCRCPYYDK